MTLFAVHAIDLPGALPSRLEHYAAHRAYVESAESLNIQVVMSGPLQSDDGEAMAGSFFLVEAPSRAEVDRFTGNDPFLRHGVWGNVSIHRFHKRKG